MKTLEVVVKNFSATNWQVCLVQKGVKMNWQRAIYTYWSVANLPAVTGGKEGRAQIRWEESLQFVTALSNGGQFTVSSSMNADRNTIKVAYNGQSLFFKDPSTRPGNTLRLESDPSIPPFGNVGTAGIGMMNSPVLVLERLSPNMTYEFEAGYEYYICVSPNARVGDVVPDNAQLTRIDFANGATTMYATLSATNQWTVSARDTVASEI